MTGELILENGGWKRRLPAAAATAVAAIAGRRRFQPLFSKINSPVIASPFSPWPER